MIYHSLAAANQNEISCRAAIQKKHAMNLSFRGWAFGFLLA